MWKVIGVLSNDDMGWSYRGDRKGATFGPHPAKRWVRVKGERYRKAFKQTKAYQGNAKESARDYTASRAKLYAEWLAARDGLVIPVNCKAFVLWSEVRVPDKVRPEARPYAVEWSRNTYDQKTQAWSEECLLTISIPHWDWVPTCTEETEALSVAA